jgi:hypothetical protein
MIDRVQEIIRLEKNAEVNQWEAARLISEELADGKSQRQLAQEIGKSQTHVRYMAKTFEIFGENHGVHGSFDLAYHSPEVRGAPQPEPTAQPEPTTRPTPTITSRPTGPRVTPDPVTGRVYTDDLPHHDTDAEVAEWRKRNPGRATPIDNYTPAKAIEDWLDTLQRVCRSMVKFTDDKESLRNRIHADVDGIFDETQS